MADGSDLGMGGLGGQGSASSSGVGVGLGGQLGGLAPGGGGEFSAQNMLGGLGAGLGDASALSGAGDDNIDDSRMEDEVAAVLGGATPSVGGSTPGGPPTTPLQASRSTSGRTPARGSPDRGRLLGRLSDPVEGCEVRPILTVRTESGHVVTGASDAVSVRWYRSNGTAPCAYGGCQERGATDAEFAAIGSGPAAGARGHFGSEACFSRGWHGYVAPPRDRRGPDRDPSGLAGLLRAGASPSAAAAPLADLARTAAAAAPGGAASAAEASSGAASSAAGGDASGWNELSASERAFGAMELARTAPAPPGSGATGWTAVHEGPSYTPGPDDVLCRLRVEVTAAVDSGEPLRKTISSAPVRPLPAAPPRRRWLSRPQRASAPAESDRGLRDAPTSLRVVTYNVLAEIYCSAGTYPYCPAWALTFEYRRRLLERELRELDGDVVCLQEVQADYYASFFLPLMTSLGYEGLFRQKARKSMGVEGKVDGCALFFRASRFRLIEKFALDFNQAVDDCYEGEVGKTAAMPKREAEARKAELGSIKRRLKHDNVAQVAVLELVSGPSGERLREPLKLCVTNTHLFWDPEYADVKLWQTHALLGELEKLTGGGDCPIVLCGDFNSEESSAVHALIAGNRAAGRPVALPQSKLPRDDLGILSHGGSSSLRHGLFLASAYGEVLGHEPGFTNFTRSYTGCLDYIWCTARHFAPVAVLAIPPAPELSGPWDSAMPNPQHPSDHVALCADLVLAPTAHRAPPRGSAAPPGAAGARRGGMLAPAASMPMRSADVPAMSSLGPRGAGPAVRAAAGHMPAGLGLPGSGQAPDPSMWAGPGGRAGVFAGGMAALGASPGRMHHRDGSGGLMGRPDFQGGGMQ